MYFSQVKEDFLKEIKRVLPVDSNFLNNLDHLPHNIKLPIFLVGSKGNIDASTVYEDPNGQEMDLNTLVSGYFYEHPFEEGYVDLIDCYILPLGGGRRCHKIISEKGLPDFIELVKLNKPCYIGIDQNYLDCHSKGWLMRKIYPKLGFNPEAALLPLIKVAKNRKNLQDEENWELVNLPIMKLIYEND